MEFIQCHHCGAAFPDDLTACPRCHKDPEPRSILRTIFLAFGFAGVILMILLFVFR